MTEKAKLYAAVGGIIAIIAIVGIALVFFSGTPAGKTAPPLSNTVPALTTVPASGADTPQVVSTLNTVSQPVSTQSVPKVYTTIRQPDETGTWVNLATIADEKGFFDEQGIKIQWTGKLGGGGPGQLASIAGGSNDVGAAAVMAIINAQNAGIRIKAVAPEYLYDKETAPKWYVLNSSGIKSAKDLIGKKIAVNTLKANQEWTIRKYLEDNGVPFSSVQLVIVDTQKVGNPYLAEQLLRKGDVAIISVSEVLEDRLLKNGGVTPLFSTYDVWGEASGNPAYVFSNDYIKKNPSAVKGYVTALAKAADFVNSNPEESLQIIIKKNYPGIDSSVVKSIKAHKYPAHALVSESQVKEWIALMEKTGDLNAGVIKPSDVYTNEFNPYKTSGA